MPKIIVVDDEEQRPSFLKRELGKVDCPRDPYQVEHVTHWDALQAIFDAPFDGGHAEIDLIVLDVDFSGFEEDKLVRRTPSKQDDDKIQGWLILEKIREWEGEEHCRAMMVSSKVDTIPADLEDYIAKYKPETYLYQESGESDRGLVKKIQFLCPAIDEQKIHEWKTNFGIVCGRSRNLYELMCRAEQIAQSDCNVWIDGEPGVGKELMAKFIHCQSPRAKKFWPLLENLVAELVQLRGLGADIFGKNTKFADKVELELSRAIPGLQFPDSRLRQMNKMERDERRADLEMNYGRMVKMREELDEDVDKLATSFRQTLHNHFEKGVPKDLWSAYVSQVENGFRNAPRQQGLVYLICREVFNLWRKSDLFGFRAFNCAELSTEPNSLLSKLFGVPAGAFTGVDMRPGIIKSTSYVRGTLFLDEIGDLKDNPPAQGALLRVLQEGELVRAQASTVETVNVRVVAATNKVIRELVKNVEFRHDLFTRIVQAYIKIPSLEERRADMSELVDWLFDKKIEDSPDIEGMEFDPIAKSYLINDKTYQWHGNIRDLKNVIDRAVEVAFLEEDHKIRIDHLTRTLNILWDVQPPAANALQSTRDANTAFLDELEKYVETFNLSGAPSEKESKLKELRENAEGLFIKRAVREFVKVKQRQERGLYTDVGKSLGIDRKTASDKKGRWRELIDKAYQAVLQEEGIT